jgi:hypothetical protein
VSGTVTRWFGGLAAPSSFFALAVLDLAAPSSFFALADPVLSFYAGNELPFPSGALFAIAHRSTGE